MRRFFLSYRRDDSAGFAGRLADALEAEFGTGSVFRDVDDIHPGEDFVHAIESQLQEVDAVLVMIGPRWLATDATGQRRLDAPDDFVRLEIAAALAAGKRLIPLLVGGAAMPPEAELPGSIAGLARRQTVVLSDSGWRDDVARLMAHLRAPSPDHATATADAAGRRTALRRAWPLLAGATAGLVLWGAYSLLRPPPAPQPAPPPVASRPAVDIAGRWTAKVTYDWGDRHDEVFEFKYLGDRLHGTVTYLTGRLTIEQASLEGEWLGFVTRSQEMLGSDSPWKEVTHRYTGQVTPDAIRFTLETTGGYSVHPPVEFTAQRVAPP